MRPSTGWLLPASAGLTFAPSSDTVGKIFFQKRTQSQRGQKPSHHTHRRGTAI